MGWRAIRTRCWSGVYKRVHRLWRALGLALPPYKPSHKIRTGMKLDGPATKRNDVWAIEFVHDSYGSENKYRCLTIRERGHSNWFTEGFAPMIGKRPGGYWTSTLEHLAASLNAMRTHPWMRCKHSTHFDSVLRKGRLVMLQSPVAGDYSDLD